MLTGDYGLKHLPVILKLSTGNAKTLAKNDKYFNNKVIFSS